MYMFKCASFRFVVPSSNKKDLRSIEQTLNDMKSRKRPKMDSTESDDSLEQTAIKRTKD